MSGGINEIKQILFSILRDVVKGHRVTLYGYASLPLQIHRIKKLFLHLSLKNRLGTLEESIGQSGFAMINMRYDTKVSNPMCFHH